MASFADHDCNLRIWHNEIWQIQIGCFSSHVTVNTSSLARPLLIINRVDPPVCQPEQTFINFNCNNVGNERAVFPLLLLSSYEWRTWHFYYPSLSHIVTNSPVSSNSWFPLVPSLIGAICHKVQTASVWPHLIPLWVFSNVSRGRKWPGQPITEQYPGHVTSIDQSQGGNV